MKARYIDLQKKRLIKGEISRRQFIRSALASGLGMSGAASIASAAEAEQPRRGGALRLSLDGRGELLTFAACAALTEIQPDGSLTGDLAESWESSPDATRWRVRLVAGAMHYTGSELEASEVADHLARFRTDFLDGLTDVTAISTRDLELVFDHPVPDLPLWLSDPHLALFGFGPYRPAPSRAKDVVVLDRFDGHYRTGGAHFDRLEIHRSGTLDDVAEGRLDLIVDPTDADFVAAARNGLIAEETQGLSRIEMSELGEICRIGRLTPEWDVRARRICAGPIVQGVADRIIRVPHLRHGELVATHLPLDGGRIAERWWFA